MTTAATTGLSRARRTLQAAVARDGLPCAAGIATDRTSAFFAEAYGYADVEMKQPMSLDTVCWFGSCTKAITVIAALQLIERGELSLDQPAGDILAYLRDPQVLTGFKDGEPQLRPAARQVTVRHLLTHTSGYGYSLWNPLLAQYERATHMPFIGTARECALHAPLICDPGERWEYGISIDQIGRIIEEVSGNDLETYSRQNLLDPLGMSDTGFVMDDVQKGRLASVYIRHPDGSVARTSYDVPDKPEFFMGGGGAFSTPRDFSRLLRMLLGHGSLDGVRILKPESVGLMHTPAIGGLQTRPMVSVGGDSAIAGDFDGLPGQRHTWGLSFDLNEGPVLGGRAAGSISWCGLLNLYYWVDFASSIAGLFVTHMLPFPDGAAVAAARQFERDIYASAQPHIL